MQNHYIEAQLKEREEIKKVYYNYLVPRNCKRLTLTSIEDFNSVDAFVLSASTRENKTVPVAIEFKNRNISISKYSDTFIEYTKWQALYDYYKANHLCLYITNYTDAISIHNTSNIMGKQVWTSLDQDFCYLNCTSNMESYVPGERRKLVRYLSFNSDCEVVRKI